MNQEGEKKSRKRNNKGNPRLEKSQGRDEAKKRRDFDCRSAKDQPPFLTRFDTSNAESRVRECPFVLWLQGRLVRFVP